MSLSHIYIYIDIFILLDFYHISNFILISKEVLLLPLTPNHSEESQSLAGTLKRTLSLVFDWGVESGIWRSPSGFIRERLPFDTLFGMALPIPDADHGLHHASGRMTTS